MKFSSLQHIRPFSKIKSRGVYVTASWIKLILGIIVLLIDATSISVKEDTAIALTLALIGVFLTLWGLSYFVFYAVQRLFTTKITQERMQKDAYKTSFLFGLFGVINILLLIGNFWSKWVSLALLFLFLGMQYMVFTDPKRMSNERTAA